MPAECCVFFSDPNEDRRPGEVLRRPDCAAQLTPAQHGHSLVQSVDNVSNRLDHTL